LKRKIIKAGTEDDAKWDRCFIDLRSRGIKTNAGFTAYDPPKDLKDKLGYYQHWEAARQRAV